MLDDAYHIEAQLRAELSNASDEIDRLNQKVSDLQREADEKEALCAEQHEALRNTLSRLAKAEARLLSGTTYSNTELAKMQAARNLSLAQEVAELRLVQGELLAALEALLDEDHRCDADWTRARAAIAKAKK